MMNEQIREKSLVRNPFDFQYITPLKSVRFVHSSREPAGVCELDASALPAPHAIL